jgi:ABC-2 type transport system ATP-binding protein
MNGTVLTARGLGKTFRRNSSELVHALKSVSMDVAHGTLTALVGPDGAGKTTLIRLAAGLMVPDTGSLQVLGIDVAAEPQRVQDRIGYMPQKFGLYEDLSVQENLDLYADLHGVTSAERRQRYPRLMEMTALGRFTERLAGRLSGGMKQKLGLACTLVRAPELLLLDEPTVGVDPLSRRELWNIIRQLVSDEGLTVLLSTSYLDEAERCSHVAVMHEGNILAQGQPHDISALAANRVFLAETPSGEKARAFQARLLDKPEVIDAVPDGGRVRFVVTKTLKEESGKLKETVQIGGIGDKGIGNQEEIIDEDGDREGGRQGRGATFFAGLTASVVEPRFEDGFMVLLKTDKESERQRDSTNRSGEKETPRQQETDGKKTDKETRRVGETDRQKRDTETTLRIALPESLPRSMCPALSVSGSTDVPQAPNSPVVQVHDLVRRFRNFVAVDHVSFEVHRGEIFGLLGPNGAGKTTTFRMLCGLLPATAGSLRVAGMDLRRARASARQNIGYVAQKFSLYGQLSVSENLEFFASAYNLRGAHKSRRIVWALRQFDLAPLANLPSDHLPGGFKQRLAMAAALLHEPQTLFLDEPTSGADPLARREFWRRITALSEQGVTVVITTHFMEEAEYCDRIAILDAGRILAQGTPAAIRGHGGGRAATESSMEDAFIAIVEEARAREAQTAGARGAA